MPDLPKRAKAEKALMLLLLPEFERQTGLMLRAGLKPIDDLAWLDMGRQTAAAMENQLRRKYALAALLMLTDTTVPLDLDDIGGYAGAERLDAAAARYGQQRSQAMGRAITEATRRRYDKIIAEAESNAEAARQAAERIEELLNRVRAEAIAATETTAATSAGENGVADIARQRGVVIRPTWNTERDDRTCPVCYPLHRVPLIDVPTELQAGPPAHALCRCWLTWERVNEMVGVLESRA